MSTRCAKVYVGLDYHTRFVQVCVLTEDGRVLNNKRLPNECLAIVQWVRGLGVVVEASVEACCGSANLAEELIQLGGWSVSLAHPGYVKRMKGSPDKTDLSDAHLLADLVRVGYLPQVWLAPEWIRQLRRLVRYRQSLTRRRRDLKLQIRGLLREHRIRNPEGVNPWTRAWRAWLSEVPALGEQGQWVMDQLVGELEHCQRQVAEVERRLHAVTKSDPFIQSLVRQPGIGPVTSWMIRAEIGRFDRFRNAKQASRFCGLSPRNHSSGERESSSGLIKASNPELRATLIQAGWRLIRCEPRWRDLAHQMESRGKSRGVIVAAVTNRWFRKIYHEMKPLGMAAQAA